MEAQVEREEKITIRLCLHVSKERAVLTGIGAQIERLIRQALNEFYINQR